MPGNTKDSPRSIILKKKENRPVFVLYCNTKALENSDVKDDVSNSYRTSM